MIVLTVKRKIKLASPTQNQLLKEFLSLAAYSVNDMIELAGHSPSTHSQDHHCQIWSLSYTYTNEISKRVILGAEKSNG